MTDVVAAWRRSVASWDGFAASADRARGGASGLPRRRVLAAGRSGGGQRADGVQGADVVALPGPARGQVQRPAARVTGQSAGDVQQSAAQRARGADGRLREAELLG